MGGGGGCAPVCGSLPLRCLLCITTIITITIIIIIIIIIIQESHLTARTFYTIQFQLSAYCPIPDLKFINVISSSSQAAVQSALNIYYSFNITEGNLPSGNHIRSNSSRKEEKNLCPSPSAPPPPKHFSGQIMCI